MRRAVILVCALAASLRLGAAEPEAIAPPPLPPSPVQQFRAWLEMTPSEREKELAEWPASNQKILRAKLDSYARLDPEERERRLAMLDLRHYMAPLLSETPSSERDRKVETIPEHYREIVRERLRQWDQLPADLKTRMIENELALQYLTRIRRKDAPSQAVQQFHANLDDSVRRRLQSWQKVPPQERLNLSARLNRFFELSREERQKTLSTLREAERQEIQRSLDALNRMTPRQRALCIQSFRKLAEMNPAEQALFLRNAARWQAMTKEERDTWKNLVHNLPPLPPDDLLPPPLPDTPPALPATASTNLRQ